MASAVSQLRFRRMVAQQAGQRIRRRKIPRMREPTQALLRYRTFVRARQKDLEQIVREILFPALPAIIAQSDAELGRVRQDAAIDDIVRVFGNIAVQYGTLHSEVETEGALTEIAETADTKNALEFRRQMKAGLGVEVIVPGTGRQSLMSTFVQENLALVKSQRGIQLDRLRSIVTRGVPGGLRVESLREQIIRDLGVSLSRADLLARDQTLKLYGQLAANRQTSLGIRTYTWSTSRDERVRPDHRALEGTRQNWSKPPIVDVRSGREAHPGQDYQCRCQALPDIEELLDAL